MWLLTKRLPLYTWIKNEMIRFCKTLKYGVYLVAVCVDKEVKIKDYYKFIPTADVHKEADMAHYLESTENKRTFEKKLIAVMFKITA